MNFFVLLIILLFSGGFVMTVVEDVPTPIRPEFVECVREHGLIGLIDRNSKEYDSKALVNGKLDVCLSENVK